MQIAQANSQSLRALSAQEVEMVGGAAAFGEWVGRLAVWSSVGGIVADAISGGAISSAAARQVGALEDWVNGTK